MNCVKKHMFFPLFVLVIVAPFFLIQCAIDDDDPGPGPIIPTINTPCSESHVRCFNSTFSVDYMESNHIVQKFHLLAYSLSSHFNSFLGTDDQDQNKILLTLSFDVPAGSGGEDRNYSHVTKGIVHVLEDGHPVGFGPSVKSFISPINRGFQIESDSKETNTLLHYSKIGIHSQWEERETALIGMIALREDSSIHASPLEFSYSLEDSNIDNQAVSLKKKRTSKKEDPPSNVVDVDSTKTYISSNSAQYITLFPREEASGKPLDSSKQYYIVSAPDAEKPENISMYSDLGFSDDFKGFKTFGYFKVVITTQVLSTNPEVDSGTIETIAYLGNITPLDHPQLSGKDFIEVLKQNGINAKEDEKNL